MNDQVTLSAYTEEIRTLIQNERDDEAIALCRHILRYYPKHIQTYGQMAEAFLQKGDLENAHELFRRVLSADPENIVAYAGLGMLHEQQKLNEEAIWHLERAFELAPANPEIRKELVRLYAEVESKPRTRLKPTPAALARLYLRQGLFPQAIQELRGLLADSPQRFDLIVLQVQALWLAGRVNEAVDLAQSLLQKLPFCLKANLIVGAAWQAGNIDEGSTFLQRAQALDPTNKAAQELLGTRSPLPRSEPVIPRYVEGQEPAPSQEISFEEFPGTNWFTQNTEAQPENQLSTFAESSPQGERTDTEAALLFESAVPTLTETPVGAAEPSPEGTPAIPEPVLAFEETPEPKASASMPKPPVVESALPPWLRADFRAQAQPPQPPQKNIPMLTAVPSSLPPWLTELQKTLSNEPGKEANEASQGDVEPTVEPAVEPASSKQEPTAAVEPSAEDELISSWTAILSKPPTEEPTKVVDDDLLPAWLKSAQEAEVPAPTSLTQASETAPTQAPAKAEEHVEETAEFPGWLKDLRVSAQKFSEPGEASREEQSQPAAEPPPGAEAEQSPAAPESGAAGIAEGETVQAEGQPQVAQDSPAADQAQPPEQTAAAADEHAHESAAGEATVLDLAAPPVIEPTAETTEKPTAAEAPAPQAEAAQSVASLSESETAAQPITETERPAAELAAQTENAASESPSSPISSQPEILVEPGLLPSTAAAPTEESPIVGDRPAVEPAPTPTSEPARRRHPDRAMGRLEQARGLRDANDLASALTEYDFIVQHAPRLVNQVIHDLEELIQRPDAPLDAHRILGDAYTRVDRLADALERYRFVLDRVS